MLLKIYSENPEGKKLDVALDILRSGGTIIYPTDSVYSLGCNLLNHKAVVKVAAIKGLKPEKANFTIIFKDLSTISEYTRPFDTWVYKLMKKALPGPFTFILEANSNVPRIFKSKKKTIGIRVPDNNIPRMLVDRLGNPIISTSIKDEDEVVEYTTDPELIHEKYQNKVDAVIDGGFMNNTATTIVDCTGDEPVILRQGIGILEDFI
ncbi:MAG: threonylcarbamoyl-AMP synthase [Bacteroidetes bacterium]|nr:MAG: threonylcarbamoyl-AMP synthase [Bacteroidota bacterium]